MKDIATLRRRRRLGPFDFAQGGATLSHNPVFGTHDHVQRRPPG